MPTFALVFVTSIGVSVVPGLTDQECAWARDHAAALVASIPAEVRQIAFVDATCEREERP